ncbi:MAG: SPW repeat protein [Armatimonadota bacterium]|nr:SPW repeat protein [Armatimonadota bacterium]MDR7466388.1 SPW repeat protein [Armatimonadota bacterium]MDR7493110.1 SPW repeat protein [Armatimonadota bacterium]MDR7498133.1 SPW repeat protein [Armatimonadota bacterium]MDR7503599.1 SPW repeat protein [Armatimonadota bacterium]
MKWVNVILGLWVLVSPFILTSANTLKWSNVIVGIVVAVVAYMATTQKS